jgi:hypothetical protein
MGTSSMPPTNFLYNVGDARVKHLLVEVWQRLPECDRAVLEELIMEVSDSSMHQDQGKALASASVVDPDTRQEGNAGDAAVGLSYIIWLGLANSKASDPACMYVIAHEFAHVVLRHSQMNVVAARLMPFGTPYKQDDIDQLNAWHEDEASLQAYVWGFQDEMKAFIEEDLGEVSPRWYNIEIISG